MLNSHLASILDCKADRVLLTPPHGDRDWCERYIEAAHIAQFPRQYVACRAVARMLADLGDPTPRIDAQMAKGCAE